MNRIFKVIFSKAKGIFVVTGESAKTQSKSKHLKAIAASVMIASVLGIVRNVGAVPVGTLPTITTIGSTIHLNESYQTGIQSATSIEPEYKVADWDKKGILNLNS